MDRKRGSSREIIPKQGNYLDKNQGMREVIMLLGDCRVSVWLETRVWVSRVAIKLETDVGNLCW